MDAATVAAGYSAQQTALARQIAAEAAKLWTGIDPANLDASWAASLPRTQALVSGGMVLAASTANTYLDDVLAAQGIDPAADARVDPRAFGRSASDGRPLDSLLQQPLIGTKTAIGGGASALAALAGGLLQLDMIVRTQLADAGRTAVGVGLTARRHAGGYVRMLNPPSCARCAVLAGRFYRWNAGFVRHPRCDCRHIPSAEDRGDDLRTGPAAYFRSLTQAEQDRLFTRAGAEAIRDGADIGQVVNARRGMYVAGGIDYTRESTTRSGVAPGQVRLMPEAIYRRAGDDRGEALRLLRQYRYLF